MIINNGLTFAIWVFCNSTKNDFIQFVEIYIIHDRQSDDDNGTNECVVYKKWDPAIIGWIEILEK